MVQTHNVSDNINTKHDDVIDKISLTKAAIGEIDLTDQLYDSKQPDQNSQSNYRPSSREPINNNQ